MNPVPHFGQIRDQLSELETVIRRGVAAVVSVGRTVEQVPPRLDLTLCRPRGLHSASILPSPPQFLSRPHLDIAHLFCSKMI